MMATQSPTLLRQISEKHRKLVRDRIARFNGELSREEYFRFNRRRWTTQIDKYTGYTMYVRLVDGMKPFLNDEEATAMATARLLSLDLLSRGIARRIVNDSPAELECALSLEARIEWMSRPRALQAAVRFTDIWSIFHGLAASDIDVARAYFGSRPQRLSDNRYYAGTLTYNAVQAIVTGNRREQKRLSPEVQFPGVPDYFRAVLRVLFGIIEMDSEIVAVELEHVLSTSWRFELSEEEKIISVIAHGLAELAYWVSPKLLEQFDVSRPFPWDSGYYRWLRRKNPSTKYRDMSKHSPLLQKWIHDLEEPSWWRRVKRQK